jgi:dTDP-4-dehydrorhamnose 3,5-epimerase
MISDDVEVQSSFDFVRIIEPRIFLDEAGSCLETASERLLQGVRSGLRLVEERLETSKGAVVRGLHYQLNRPQGRLMRVITGSAFVVAVDMRRSSPEFSCATCLELTEEGRQAVWAPEGYAFGYMTLQEGARVLIKSSEREDARFARTLLWNDPDLGIEWPRLENVVVTEKDQRGRPLALAECLE